MTTLFKFLITFSLLAGAQVSFAAETTEGQSNVTPQTSQEITTDTVAPLTNEEVLSALRDVVEKQQSVNHLSNYLRDQQMRCYAGGAAYIVVQRWLVNLFRKTYRSYRKGRPLNGSMVSPMTLASQLGLNGYLAYTAGVGVYVSCTNLGQVSDQLREATRALEGERLALQSRLSQQ